MGTAAIGRIAGWASAIRVARSGFPGFQSPAEISDSRAQVLAAATLRVLAEPFEVLTQGLNPSRFDQWKPGLRRKTYRYFPSTSDLLREVLGQAVGPDRGRATDELVRAMKEGAQDPPPMLQTLAMVAPAYVDRVGSDDLFALQLHAWLVARADPKMQSAMSELHDSLVARTSEGFAAILHAWGLELRPPFTWRSFCNVWISLVEGSALRAGVEGERYEPALASAVTMVLIVGMTRSIDEDERDLVGLLHDHCRAARS